MHQVMWSRLVFFCWTQPSLQRCTEGGGWGSWDIQKGPSLDQCWLSAILGECEVVCRLLAQKSSSMKTRMFCQGVSHTKKVGFPEWIHSRKIPVRSLSLTVIRAASSQEIAKISVIQWLGGSELRSYGYSYSLFNGERAKELPGVSQPHASQEMSV